MLALNVASVGHVAVGLLAARMHGGASPRQSAAVMATFGAFALLPDVDVAWVALGVPDTGALGHRGFTHSLPFALAVAALTAFFARRRGLRPLHTGLFAFLAVASHGVLDAFTHDSRGIPFLWPLSDARIAFFWRPIPNPPTGLAFLSVRGCEVAAVEALYFAPLLLVMLWPRARLRPRAGPVRLSLRVSVVVGAIALCVIHAQLVLRGTAVVAWLERSSTEGPVVEDRALLR